MSYSKFFYLVVNFFFHLTIMVLILVLTLVSKIITASS